MPRLSELTEEQRGEAYKRYKLIRESLEEGVPQTVIARESGVPLKTVQRWIRRYRQDGLRGLARLERSDKGKQRGLTEEQVKVVEGLALRKPRRTVVTIQRQVNAIALEQGWREASYGQVRQIVEKLSPALQTLAHEGAETYREEYDLLYRREAKGPNEIWQADHCLLPIWIRDEDGREGRPFFTGRFCLRWLGERCESLLRSEYHGRSRWGSQSHRRSACGSLKLACEAQFSLTFDLLVPTEASQSVLLSLFSYAEATLVFLFLRQHCTVLAHVADRLCARRPLACAFLALVGHAGVWPRVPVWLAHAFVHV